MPVLRKRCSMLFHMLHMKEFLWNSSFFLLGPILSKKLSRPHFIFSVTLEFWYSAFVACAYGDSVVSERAPRVSLLWLSLRCESMVNVFQWDMDLEGKFKKRLHTQWPRECNVLQLKHMQRHKCARNSGNIFQTCCKELQDTHKIQVIS